MGRRERKKEVEVREERKREEGKLVRANGKAKQPGAHNLCELRGCGGLGSRAVGSRDSGGWSLWCLRSRSREVRDNFHLGASSLRPEVCAPWLLGGHLHDLGGSVASSGEAGWDRAKEMQGHDCSTQSLYTVYTRGLRQVGVWIMQWVMNHASGINTVDASALEQEH
jgi:hypothetical protein